jgi:hypothetical protein
METVYFASSLDDNVFIFDFRKDDYILLIEKNVVSFDWNPQLYSDLAILSKDSVDIFDFNETNKFKKSMKMDKNYHLLKYTLTGDTILLGDVDINVLDSTNLNILHTFEGHISSVVNLEIVDKNQLLSLSDDGNIRSWLLQVQIQDDEEDDEIIDFKVSSEENKMMGLSGIASIGYPKDDVVPVPPTSAGIFGSDSQLIYFSSFSSHDIYENRIPRIYKDLLVFHLNYLSKRIVCHQTPQVLN